LIKKIHKNGFLLQRQIDQLSLDGFLMDTFDSFVEANKKTGVDMGAICLVCRGRRKTAGGYIWRYNNSKEKIETDPLDDLAFKDNYLDGLIDEDLI
jgi:hypothetical protein